MAEVGYRSSDIGTPAGSINQQPNPAHKILLLAYEDGIGVRAQFLGDVTTDLNAWSLFVDGTAYPVSTVSFDAGTNRTSAVFTAEASPFADGESYAIEFKEEADAIFDPISLSASTIVENSAAGTLVGTVVDKTADSVLTLLDDAGGRFAVSSNSIVAGLVAADYETATDHKYSITVRQSKDGYEDQDTVFEISVTNEFEQPDLGTLTLSATNFVIGTPSSGTINGATTGSTITSGALPSGLTIDGAARTWAWSGEGTVGTGNISLLEAVKRRANGTPYRR